MVYCKWLAANMWKYLRVEGGGELSLFSGGGYSITYLMCVLKNA